MEIREFLKQTRQKIIGEKQAKLQKQQKWAQGARAVQLEQHIRTLNYLSEHPTYAPPAAVANLVGEIREEVDYAVAVYALAKGYRADDLAESMKSEFYEREYVERPDLAATVVGRAQTKMVKRQHASLEL